MLLGMCVCGGGNIGSGSRSCTWLCDRCVLCSYGSPWKVETLATVIITEKEREVGYRDGGDAPVGDRDRGHSYRSRERMSRYQLQC